MHNHKQILLAREYRKLKIGDLAKKSSIKVSQLSKIEHGLIAPSKEHVSSIAQALNFPSSFFSADISANYNTYPYPRTGTGMPKKEYVSLLAKVDILLSCVDILLSHFDVDAVNSFANVSAKESPYELACFLQDNLNICLQRKPSIRQLNAILSHNRIFTLFLDCHHSIDARLVQSREGNLILLVNSQLPSNKYKIVALRELYFWIQSKDLLYKERRFLWNHVSQKDAQVFVKHMIMPKQYLYLVSSYRIGLDAIINESKKLGIYPDFYVDRLADEFYCNFKDKVSVCITSRKHKDLKHKIKLAGLPKAPTADSILSKDSIINMCISKFCTDLGYTYADLADMCHIQLKDFFNLFAITGKSRSLT